MKRDKNCRERKCIETDLKKSRICLIWGNLTNFESKSKSGHSAAEAAGDGEVTCVDAARWLTQVDLFKLTQSCVQSVCVNMDYIQLVGLSGTILCVRVY